MLRESLVLEEMLFNYAYHGSQEALDKEVARVNRLLARSQQEMNETAQKYGADRAKMQVTSVILCSQHASLHVNFNVH